MVKSVVSTGSTRYSAKHVLVVYEGDTGRDNHGHYLGYSRDRRGYVSAHDVLHADGDEVRLGTGAQALVEALAG